jgi:hypothetical protein
MDTFFKRKWMRIKGFINNNKIHRGFSSLLSAKLGQVLYY